MEAETDRHIPLSVGALLGTLTSLAVIALTYFGERVAGLPFVPFDLFDWLARNLPGGIVTLGIDLIVGLVGVLRLGDTSTASKIIEQLAALLLLIAGGALFGAILARRSREHREALIRSGVFGGALLLVLTLLIELSLGFPSQNRLAGSLWLAGLFLAWGLALGWLVREAATSLADSPDAPLPRRQFLYLVGGGFLTISLGSIGLTALLGRERLPTGPEDGRDLVEEMTRPGSTSGPAASPPSEVLAARIEPAPGTRAELTPNEDFYRIDINTRPPVVDGKTWRLEVSGLVETPLSLTLDEIRKIPPVSQVVTMQCISNPIGGDLTGTSRWTGVRFRDLLALAGLRQGAQEILIESVDGFYESVALEDAMDERTLLVYEMNGVPLPIPNGFPLRVYIPDRYGMKQPKWISRMEVLDRKGNGYWVDRGWSEAAIAHTTSVIDTVALDRPTDDQTVPVGGIAWAGARGISKVEVQVDDGPWVEAELRAPPLSPLSWVQWRYDWPPVQGRHTFRVRAYDGNGDLQTLESRRARPNGATGVHSVAMSF